nr:uncharacterized protein LOC128703372 [Cherax quadricarinatus]
MMGLRARIFEAAFLSVVSVTAVLSRVTEGPPNQASRLDALPLRLSINNYLWESVLEFYLPLPERIDNEDCKKDVREVLTRLNVANTTEWANKLVDSWGKMPDGFLFGNVHMVGVYEECVSLSVHYTLQNYHYHQQQHYRYQQQHYHHRQSHYQKDEEQRSFDGKYCLVAYL